MSEIIEAPHSKYHGKSIRKDARHKATKGHFDDIDDPFVKIERGKSYRHDCIQYDVTYIDMELGLPHWTQNYEKIILKKER